MTSYIKLVFLWKFLLTITNALNTVLNVDELNSIHYAVDILNKPVLKEKVSRKLHLNEVKVYFLRNQWQRPLQYAYSVSYQPS